MLAVVRLGTGFYPEMNLGGHGAQRLTTACARSCRPRFLCTLCFTCGNPVMRERYANERCSMNANPYDPPNTPFESPTDVVDRTQRDALAAVVRQFLDDDVTAFEFDEQLDEFRNSSDSAVRFVAQAVWLHYDDCDDHLVALAKPEWDYFQRLLLLLESNRCVQTKISRRWSLSQLIALLSLLGFLWVAFQVGWGYHLLIAAVPFGIISIGISWLRRTTVNVGPYDPIIFPFATFSDLKSTYDGVVFKKSRYPQRMKTRRIRSPFMSGVYQIQFYVMWLMLSPIALVIQVFPPAETHTRVIVA